MLQFASVGLHIPKGDSFLKIPYPDGTPFSCDHSLQSFGCKVESANGLFDGYFIQLSLFFPVPNSNRPIHGRSQEFVSANSEFSMGHPFPVFAEGVDWFQFRQ